MEIKKTTVRKEATESTASANYQISYETVDGVLTSVVAQVFVQTESTTATGEKTNVTQRIGSLTWSNGNTSASVQSSLMPYAQEFEAIVTVVKSEIKTV